MTREIGYPAVTNQRQPTPRTGSGLFDFSISNQELGFEDGREMQSLVEGLDLSTPEKRDRFKRWQTKDGTKEGLVRLLEVGA